MKKFSNFLLTISAFILSVVMVGCGNSNKNLFMSKAERYKTTLVPVFRVKNENGKRVFLVTGIDYYAIKSGSEGFERFDNDADYEEYAIPIEMASLLNTWYDFDYENELIEKYGDYWWEKCTYDESIQLYGERDSLIKGVVEYLYGDKKNIPDEKLYKKLDKFYYDEHPEEWQFRLEDSQYGFKKFRANLKYNMPLLFLVSSSEADQYFYFSNKEVIPIPEGSVIFQ